MTRPRVVSRHGDFWCGSSPVGGGSGVMDNAIGTCPGGFAFGGHRETPSAFVDEMVMPLTQRHQIGQIGRTPMQRPMQDVMDPARIKPDRTIRMRTRPVQRAKRSPLLACRRPLRTALIEYPPRPIEHHREHLGVTTQPTNRRRRKRHPVLGLTDRTDRRRQTSKQPVVDHNRDLGNTINRHPPNTGSGDTSDRVGVVIAIASITTGTVTGDRRNERIDLHLLPRHLDRQLSGSHPSNRPIHRRVQLRIADRVEFDAGAVHAGRLVDPARDLGSGTLRLELLGIG
jgi:hypothetical protein